MITNSEAQAGQNDGDTAKGSTGQGDLLRKPPTMGGNPDISHLMVGHSVDPATLPVKVYKNNNYILNFPNYGTKFSCVLGP